MAKKPATKTAPVKAMPAEVNVMVLHSNVWTDKCKFLQHDVITVDNETAELMVEKGLAKITKDDATHTVGGDNGKMRVPVDVAED